MAAVFQWGDQASFRLAFRKAGWLALPLLGRMGLPWQYWENHGRKGDTSKSNGDCTNKILFFFFWDLHKPMIPLITAPQYFEGVPLYVSTHPNGWIIIFSVRKYPHHSFLHSQILNGLSAKNWNPIPTSSRKCYVISVISHHYLSLLIILCYSMLHPQDPNFCWTSSPGGC